MVHGFLICGPPGTGKSTHIRTMLHKAGFDEAYVLADPDKLPGDHKEQSEGALKLLKDTIAENKNVVYVGSCLSTRTLMSVLRDMKKHKYRTVVAVAYTTVPTALKRIALRHDQPLDPDIAHEVHTFFASKADRFMSIPNVDELYLYNNEDEFNLLLSKKKKKIVCVHPEGEFYFDISKYC